MITMSLAITGISYSEGRQSLFIGLGFDCILRALLSYNLHARKFTSSQRMSQCPSLRFYALI